MLARILIAVISQEALALKMAELEAGAATAIAWSLSREITQPECRWIEQRLSCLRQYAGSGCPRIRTCGSTSTLHSIGPFLPS
jgi:hypothetical protein